MENIERLMITEDSFGSNCPNNWEEIATALNDKIMEKIESEKPETFEDAKEIVNAIWEDFCNGEMPDVPAAEEEENAMTITVIGNAYTITLNGNEYRIIDTAGMPIAPEDTADIDTIQYAPEDEFDALWDEETEEGYEREIALDEIASEGIRDYIRAVTGSDDKQEDTMSKYGWKIDATFPGEIRDWQEFNKAYRFETGCEDYAANQEAFDRAISEGWIRYENGNTVLYVEN